MSIECPQCGAENKKGNKFCFECGANLGSVKKPKKPISSIEAKKLRLKRRWLRGEITAEEYRGKMLKIRLREKFGPHFKIPEDDKG